MKRPGPSFTCPLCGWEVGSTVGADADALAGHQTTATCEAGRAAVEAQARGLVRPLFFETKLNHALHRSPDDINRVRVEFLRAHGVEVFNLPTKLGRVGEGGARPRGGRASFIIDAEPWAPLWAVALVWSGAEPRHLEAALLRVRHDTLAQQSIVALVNLMLPMMMRDSTVDLRGPLRAVAEAA